MKKRAFSFLVALCLLLTLLPATALADTTVTAPEPTYGWYTSVTEGTEYTISSLSDYLGFVKLTNGAAEIGGTATTDYFSGKTVKLDCDVDFDGIPFLYRASDGTITSNWRVGTFKGVFDGQGHTIKNVTYTDEYTSGSCGMGIFRNVYGNIQNLNVENVTATANTALSFGGIAVYKGKYNDSVTTGIYNCHVKNVRVTSNATSGVNSYIGGIVGYIHDNTEITDCSVTDFTLTTNNMVEWVGGLAGIFFISHNSEKGKVDNCHVKNFTANVASLAGRGEGASGNFGGIGGMLGYGHSGQDAYAFPITDCSVDGVNITVGAAYNMSYVGGFIGMSRRRYNATNCTVSNGCLEVTSAGEGKLCYVGGFCGAPTGVDTGPMGSWPHKDTGTAAVAFENCSTDVTVIAHGSCVAGGFAGLVGATHRDGDYSARNTARFTNCTASGNVVGDTKVGHFVGDNQNDGTRVLSEPTEYAGTGAIITLPDGASVTRNTDGSIELPANTTMTISDGTATTLTSGGTILTSGQLVVYADTLELDKTSLSLSVGTTADLTATTDPTDSPVKWTSDAPSVATVDESGKVTAVGVGTATITAASGAAQATCTVTVFYIPPTPSYPVSVTSALNGTATVSTGYAVAGATVTVAVTPDAGYALAALTVLDQRGNVIPLTDRGNGTYSFQMPAGNITVQAAFVPEKTVEDYFVDVPAGQYYYDAVLWAVTNGITGGVDENHFGPDQSCTRAQLVTFLWRAAGCPVVSGAVDFSDVGSGYYTEAVRWAASMGIVDGYGDGLFGTGDDITREQLVTILYRFAVQVLGMDAVTMQELVSGYGDAGEVSDYAIPAMNWALASGIVQGADGDLMPGQSCTRAEIVTMLYRLLGK